MYYLFIMRQVICLFVYIGKIPGLRRFWTVNSCVFCMFLMFVRINGENELQQIAASDRNRKRTWACFSP